MNSISRRRFALGAGALGLSVATSRKGFGFSTENQRVEIQAGVELGVIRPELHGHFVEHLGSCVYGGLWVGKNSGVPNINGHRRAAVEYLKQLGIPVLRWPGGCFADDYHWRDGIGPVEKRPRSVNLHWGMYTEDNSFGTHEFIELCRLIGADPYLAGNMGSGTPRELRDWLEYCNFPSGSTLAGERAANGSPEPFGVRYWGVGNENWGCGGNMTPEEYASHYRRFATYLRPFGDVRPFLIACGPNRNNVQWTRGFFGAMPRLGMVHGYAMHFYSNGRNFATKFNAGEMQEQLASFAELEKGILQQRALLDSYDPERRIGLMIDEWGIWDRMVPEEEKTRGRLWQQITMRCAIGAALGLNVFHRQAEKLIMCNIAQTVNVLHALLLTEGEHCVRTSTYYAFELMKAHRSKTAVRAVTEDKAAVGLSVSASRQAGEMAVTFVNPKPDTIMQVNCSLAGAKAASVRARMLHHTDWNAFNGFETPNVIVPADHPVKLDGAGVRAELPPLSIVTALIRLAA